MGCLTAVFLLIISSAVLMAIGGGWGVLTIAATIPTAFAHTVLQELKVRVYCAPWWIAITYCFTVLSGISVALKILEIFSSYTPAVCLAVIYLILTILHFSCPGMRTEWKTFDTLDGRKRIRVHHPVRRQASAGADDYQLNLDSEETQILAEQDAPTDSDNAYRDTYDDRAYEDLTEAGRTMLEINHWLNMITDTPPQSFPQASDDFALAVERGIQQKTAFHEEMHTFCAELFRYCQHIRKSAAQYRSTCFRLYQIVLAHNTNGFSTEDSLLEAHEKLLDNISDTLMKTAERARNTVCSLQSPEDSCRREFEAVKKQSLGLIDAAISALEEAAGSIEAARQGFFDMKEGTLAPASQSAVPTASANGEQKTYIYCSISFRDNGRTYYYRTDDSTLTCGDEVIVPAGDGQRKSVGRIEKIESFTAQNAPFPPAKTKEILGRCSY